MYVNICICVYVCVYVYMHIHKHVCMQIYIHICTYMLYLMDSFYLSRILEAKLHNVVIRSTFTNLYL